MSTQVEAPGPSAGSPAPANLGGEWYVAENGVQSGPLDLGQARDWVLSRAVGADLFCWTDGFDDWVAVDTVAQFSGLRGGQARRAPIAQPQRGPGPGAPSPMFADLGGARLGPEGPDSGPELEIGEVSRIVNVSMLTRPSPANEPAGNGRVGAGSGSAEAIAGRAAAVRRTGGVQAFRGTGGMQAYRGTGGVRALGGTGGLPALRDSASLPQIQKKHSRGFWLLVALGIGALGSLSAVLLYMALGQDDADAGLRRSAVARGELGYELLPRGSGKEAQDGDDSPAGEPKDRRTGGTRNRDKRTRTRPTATKPSGDEVDLTRKDEGPIELTPDDVMAKYKQNGFAVNRCYERALKKDPFLEIRRANVTVSIDTRGRASASIPGIANKQLRTCLEATIRSWKFSKPKEPLRAQLTMVFKAR